MKSIRATLLLWLIGASACGIAAVMLATYTFARAELRQVFDAELEQIARAVDLREDWVEAGRVRIAREGVRFAVRAFDTSGQTYFETALPSVPKDVPRAAVHGFAFVDTGQGQWRVYTHVSPQGVVQVGQPVEARAALARELSLQVLIPLLLFVPILALLILWALRRGLAPVEETSRRVSARDAARLDPLPTETVPAELMPLVLQINALMGRLAASLDTQRRFLADAAHGLRSPVAALALQAELAERAQSDESRAAAQQSLARGVERIRRLVQQLLHFARLDPGAPVEPSVPVNIAAVIRDVIAAHVAHAERKGVDLGADTVDELLLLGNEDELCALVENLVDNALRYAPRDTAVTVSARPDGDAIAVRVVDAGPGIPAEDRQQVFERFFRVEGDATPGTGLGLAIAKAIVERHGGRIELADATPGHALPGLAVNVRLRVA